MTTEKDKSKGNHFALLQSVHGQAGCDSALNFGNNNTMEMKY